MDSASSEDPRSILDDAARRRLPCQVLARGGDWADGHFVRVDKAGVVVVVPGIGLSGGEDVRVWFSMEEQPRSFEAAVLRAGVPVPDRSQDGLMLGFIDGWKSESGGRAEETGVVFELLAPNGKGIDLVGGQGRLVALSASEMSFAIPAEVALKFVEGGEVTVRYREDQAEHRLVGTVRRLAPGEGHILYALSFDSVDDETLHLKAIASLQRFC